jgi:two-component system NarL family sensor kinase
MIRYQSTHKLLKLKEIKYGHHIVVIEEILRVHEEERNLLARQIHDELGSLLASGKYSLNHLKSQIELNPLNEKSLDYTEQLIDRAMLELRRLTHNMMPEVLMKYGLDECLREYCAHITTFDLEVKYLSFNAIERFEVLKEISVYRNIQELLSNVVQHAKASKVLVQLSRQGNQVTVSVEDNGIGFDIKDLQTSNGSGWRSINNKIQFLQGSIEILSGHGKGTSVTFDFHVLSTYKDLYR